MQATRGSGAQGRFAVETYRSLGEAEATWRKFAGEGWALPYQTFDWAQAWFTTMNEAEGTEPYLLAVYCNGAPLLFLPLGLSEARGLGTRWRVLSLLPGTDTGDQLAPVLAGRAGDLSEFEARAMWRAISHALPPADFLRLENMPATIYGRSNPLFQLDWPFHHQKDCHLTRLGTDWGSYFASKRKSSQRADSRRRLRRLQELGEVEFRTVDDPEECDRVIDAMVRQKRAWITETGLRDGFASDNLADFYREVAKNCWPSTRLAVLTVDGEIIATDLGFVGGSHFHGVKNSNEGGEWRKYSPGVLLLEWVLPHCIENGLEFANFGTGDAEYKKIWCETSISLYQAEIRLSTRARLASVPWQAKRQLDTTIKGLRGARSA